MDLRERDEETPVLEENVEERAEVYSDMTKAFASLGETLNKALESMRVFMQLNRTEKVVKIYPDHNPERKYIFEGRKRRKKG